MVDPHDDESTELPRDGGARAGTEDEATWPPSFPHPLIDDLIERLEDADSLDQAGLAQLLSLVSREAQRMRTTVIRLSVGRMTEIDREAHRILTEAADQAASLRSLGLEALEARLDEADQVSAGLRAAFRTELEAARLAARVRHRTHLSPIEDPEGGPT